MKTGDFVLPISNKKYKHIKERSDSWVDIFSMFIFYILWANFFLIKEMSKNNKLEIEKDVNDDKYETIVTEEENKLTILPDNNINE